MVKDRLAKLIDVKSIVTILLTAAFVYLAVVGAIDSAQFISIFTVVIAFYFGTQYSKSQGKDKGES